jgi:hypothetical protein
MKEETMNGLVKMNFLKNGDSWVGKYKGYFFKLNETPDYVEILCTFSTNEIVSDLTDFLNGLQQDNSIGIYSLENNYCTIRYGDTQSKPILDLMSDLSSKFAQIGLHNKCERCNSFSFLDFYKKDTSTELLCDDCYRDVEKKAKAIEEMPSNYVAGLLSSFLGAMIGSVLWIVIGALGFYASIAGYAIAYMSFKGYDIAKGKKTITGILINVFSITTALLIAQYIGLYIDLLKEFPGFEVIQFLQITPLLFSNSEFVIGLLPNIGLGLLFALLGVYRTIKDNYHKAKSMQISKFEKIVL